MERIHELIKALNISDVITSTQFKMGAAISGGLGTLVNFMYGKTNLIWIVIFGWIIMLDWITGSRASKLDGTYSSQYGIEGITRTVVLLSLPALAHFFDMALKLPDFFFFMVTGGLIYHIFNSFAANCARIGWEKWIPAWLLESVASEIQAKIQRSDARKEKHNTK
ncbi:phage holin family protein [Bacillus toyonensis]|uniref:phage holin family protein n=1 Tax=Bacillus toyonensis TaxID=155322 RepID=UPI0002793E51|nr:phage holin family protein [Bacillus toyonensis]KNH39608.1 holin [Bacillus thuringiensis]OTX37740.1 holin [Bacillus thuringiensis serovar malayensis]OUB02424.1 holin [Bacillus thuringiensis serovar shandongiensis]EJQ82486.1 toxin secretion/phage lysis holin [Bacillus toyonensis]EJQ89462.1 toxin secretion/phage lysis holin [Bacillus toyonensis]